MGRRKDKKNPLNPYILDEMEDDDQRIGSLLDQGVSIKVEDRRQITNINANSSGNIGRPVEEDDSSGGK